MWSDTEGAFAGGTIGVSNVNTDEDEIEAYYGDGVTFREVLSGNATNDGAQQLRIALAN